MDSVGCIVVGAGVVGLACARETAERGVETIVLEAADRFGSETSSRNSEVIHSGLYYPTGSLKAQACVAGRRRLYDYLQTRGLPHRRCGKLVVATTAGEVDHLRRLQAIGVANGVEELTLIDGDEAMRMEPALRCVGALLVPCTGIFDSHAYMTALLTDLEAAGGVLSLRSRVIGGAVLDNGFRLDVLTEDGPISLIAERLIVSAGLSSQTFLASIRGLPAQAIPRMYFAKGNYFNFSGRSPFERLIYPAPNEAGLGVHITFDLGGQIRFGPDVEWIDNVDYDVDPRRGDSFYAAVRRYWPGLPDGSISPAYAGVRPKLAGPGQPAADFVVQGPAEHRVPGLVSMLGIESPGLTSSLALAKLAVDAMLADR